MRFFLTDTETTGLSSSDAVCEIAYMEIDDTFNVLSSGNSLINPLIPIHYAASAVNGITDAMVANAPTIEEYMESIGYPFLFKDIVFTGHNASFDYRFLKDFVHPDAQVLCTLKCARVIYPDATNHKQATLATMLGINLPRDKMHSADGDLQVLKQLLECLCRDSDCGLEQLLHVQKVVPKLKVLRWGKKHYGKNIEDVPLDYIQWMLTESKGVSPELRAGLEAHLVARN